MARVLRTFPFPRFDAAAATGLRVVTPHRAAASSVGAAYYSLPRMARETLRANGIAVADRFHARELLRSTAIEIAGRERAAIITARIEPILVTMLRRGIDPEALIGSGLQNARELGEFAAAYTSKLSEYGLIDGAAAVATASRLGASREPIAVWGHFRPRPEEVALIDRMAADGSIFWLPVGNDAMFDENRRHAARLAASGWIIEPDGDTDERHYGTRAASAFLSTESLDAECSAYLDRRHEVRAALGSIKRRVAAGSPISEFAIVCPNISDHADLVSAVAAEYQIPIRLPHDLSLDRTAVGSFVLDLMAVFRSRAGFDEVAHFAKHPYGPGLTQSEWLAARGLGTSGIDDWRAVVGDGQMSAIFDIEYENGQPLSVWIAIIKGMLDRYDLRRKTAFSPRESLAVNECYRVLSRAVKYDDLSELSADRASAVIAELLSDASVPFQPGIGGVTVYDPDTVIGASFDTVFILGLSEGHFPVEAKDDGVIDFYTRRKLAAMGIEFGSAADIARSAGLSFYSTLLAARREIVFSMPSSIGKDETVASPFVDRLGLTAVKRRVADISSIDEYRLAVLRETEISCDAIVDKARHAHEVETHRELSADRNEWDGMISVGIDPRSRKWSASQLTTLGKCSFRWFANYILQVREPDELDLGIDVSLLGTFYHRVLEIAVGRSMSADNIREATLAELESAFIEAENDPEIAIPASTNWELQREEHLRTLRNAISAPKFIADGSTVLGVEQRFETDWNGILVNGTIDRVDLTPDGMAAIDYKTSSSKPAGAKDDDGNPNFDIQIPLYANVGLAKLYPGRPLGSSVYYSLKKGTVMGSRNNVTLDQLERRVDDMMQQLREGQFPVDPDTGFVACKYCDLDTVCRRGQRLERKSPLRRRTSNEEVAQ